MYTDGLGLLCQQMKNSRTERERQERAEDRSPVRRVAVDPAREASVKRGGGGSIVTSSEWGLEAFSFLAATAGLATLVRRTERLAAGTRMHG